MELSIIQSKIYEIRGVRVMLDFDLAETYHVETRVLNQAVKRNIKRFPPDFMFQLTKDEFDNLMSQIVISSWGGTRKLPFAFTEFGATMLSTVLRSDVAIEASVLVVRAFVAVRNLVLNPPIDKASELQKEIRELKQYVEDVFSDYNDINEDTRIQLELLNQSLAELQAKKKELDKPRNPIWFVAIEESRKNQE